jgi:MFS family permease
MTSLDSNPVTVSLVQVATSLPMFLFALPAGALADIVDKRRFLIVVEIGIMVISALFAAMVTLDLVTPLNLLIFMFVIRAGSALTAPAWQSIVPLLVPAPTWRRRWQPTVSASTSAARWALPLAESSRPASELPHPSGWMLSAIWAL